MSSKRRVTLLARENRMDYDALYESALGSRIYIPRIANNTERALADER